VVNRHETDDIETKIDLQAGKYTGKATINMINAGNLDARNTIDESPVSIKTDKMTFKGNVIQHTFPAHSFTQVEISTK
jgi:alpha-N-arabinofuranosidase